LSAGKTKKGVWCVKKYWRDLKTEFAGYNDGRFAKDLMAWVTVAAVALPLALAFGVSSGATADGDYRRLLRQPFGRRVYQISGQTGAMAAILCP